MSLANPLLSATVAPKQGRRAVLVCHGAFHLSRPPAVTCLISSSSSTSSNASTITFTASVRSLPPELYPAWKLNSRHIIALNTIACCVAIASSWVFFSVIPSLLALKNEAQEMETLLDKQREEIPGAMAAMRLSVMEISDLTTELSKLGMEISQGIRNSSRFLRLMSLPQSTMPSENKSRTASSVARKLAEGIVKWRSAMANLLALSQFSRQVLGFLAARRRRS